MSETELERLARLEVQVEQLQKLPDLVTDMKTTLDQIKGGSRVVYALMAGSAAVGGLVAKFIPWSVR